MDVLNILLLATGDGRVAQVLVESDLAGVSLAGGQLDPLAFLGVGASQLNNLDVLWILRVLVDLHELVVVFGWPLFAAGGLSVRVPVTVWSLASISGLDVSVLVLRHLMLVLHEWLASLDHIIVDLRRLAVGVVLSVLRSVGLRRRGCRWFVGWSRSDIVGIVALASGDDRVAQIFL